MYEDVRHTCSLADIQHPVATDSDVNVWVRPSHCLKQTTILTVSTHVSRKQKTSRLLLAESLYQDIGAMWSSDTGNVG